ncbi:hypothetical protein BCR37DRAFT_86438 [Protomyces lactucae-debilis]|uniref:Uncharacterized protein n=1 Tax=Protomyces lactucae-debilis TaxID=2754530 RepID=A0A1Y2F690_PROLT|nr:uncharacterized protein BCR37DRAFT_86438 [Protomyces lactucae-debilis]ORY79401.1 hypothetical protein BCR37DRAFT_86438 [Protomyces lactucae-debilis]
MESANDLLRQQMQQAQRNAGILPNALSFPAVAMNATAASRRQQGVEEDLPGYEAQGNQATQYQFSRQDFATYNLSCLHDPQRSHLVQLIEDTVPLKKRRLLSKRNEDVSKERLKSRTIRVCRRRELAYSAQVTDDYSLAEQRCAEIRPTFKKSFNLRQQDPYIPLDTSNGLIHLHLYRGDYYHFSIPLEDLDTDRGIRLEWRIQWAFLNNKKDYKLRRIFKGMKLGILGGPTTQIIGWFLPTAQFVDGSGVEHDADLSRVPTVLRYAVQSAQVHSLPLERNRTDGSARSETSMNDTDLNTPAVLGNLILADAELSSDLVPGWPLDAPARQESIVELIREMATTSFLALYFRVVMADTMHERIAKYTQDGASLGRGMMC